MGLLQKITLGIGMSTNVAWDDLIHDPLIPYSNHTASPLMLLSNCYITVTGTAPVLVCDRHCPVTRGLVPHDRHDLHIVPRLAA